MNIKLILIVVWWFINYVSCSIINDTLSEQLTNTEKKGTCKITMTRAPYRMEFKNLTQTECDTRMLLVNLAITIDNNNSRTSSSVKFSGSCYYESLGYCVDYYFSDYSLSSCGIGSTISKTDNCYTRNNNTAGYCKLDSGPYSSVTLSPTNYIIRVYNTTTYTMDSATSNCVTLGGKFSGSPF